MIDKLMKLKEMKKGSGEMRPVEKNAKMSVLKDLIGEAGNEMSSGLHGLKKVSVMAPNQRGLEKGLDKAKQLVEGSSEEESSDMSPEMADEMGESHEGMECSPEEMEMSPEELDQKIQALMKLKEDKMSSHEGM